MIMSMSMSMDWIGLNRYGLGIWDMVQVLVVLYSKATRLGQVYCLAACSLQPPGAQVPRCPSALSPGGPGGPEH